MYIEGFATYFENLIWGRERTQWYKECLTLESRLKDEYLKRINENIDCKDFYGDWWTVIGISDTGYFLGYRFIQRLLERYEIIQIAKMDYNNIEREIISFLKK